MNLEININYPPLRVPLQKLKGIVSVILLILFFFYTPLHAQIVIEGTVTSTKKVPIQGVNVILSQKNQYNILSYFTTDKNGRYLLSAQVQVDSLQITLNCLGHEKVVCLIAPKSQTLNFELNEQVIQLKEVIASAPSITESSDTLSYLVSKFATESDKVIEDVLKKMPGIEVSESGQISYQGN